MSDWDNVNNRSLDLPFDDDGNRVQTGSGGRFGMIVTQEDRQLLKGFLKETIVAFKHDPVKTDEELIDRLEEYFETCAQTGQIPTIEEMLLTIGFRMSVARDILYGRSAGLNGSQNTRHILQAGYDFVSAVDAKLVVSGKMNFLSYCFRAKNFYGMTDKVEHVITPVSDSVLELDVDQLALKYGINDTVSTLEAESEAEKKKLKRKNRPPRA